MSEMPSTLIPDRRTDVFDQETIPEQLTTSHVIAKGEWGMIRVLEGEIVLKQLEPPAEDTTIVKRIPGVLEPDRTYAFAPSGPVRFFIEYFREPRG